MLSCLLKMTLLALAAVPSTVVWADSESSCGQHIECGKFKGSSVITHGTGSIELLAENLRIRDESRNSVSITVTGVPDDQGIEHIYSDYVFRFADDGRFEVYEHFGERRIGEGQCKDRQCQYSLVYEFRPTTGSLEFSDNKVSLSETTNTEAGADVVLGEFTRE